MEMLTLWLEGEFVWARYKIVERTDSCKPTVPNGNGFLFALND